MEPLSESHFLGMGKIMLFALGKERFHEASAQTFLRRPLKRFHMKPTPPARPSFRRFLALILLGVTFFSPLSAEAWNAAGHRLIARIAWDFLDPQTRLEVADLLRTHPDYVRWQQRGQDRDADRNAFIEASTWPDEIRKDTRFYEVGRDAASKTLLGFPDMEQHREWHYVNRPVGSDLPENYSRGLLDQALPAMAQTITAKKASLTQRSYALPWLIHLVGDAHQPLHTSRKPLGGSPLQFADEQKWANPFNPQKPPLSLHGFWDSLPGPLWLRGARLDEQSKALVASFPYRHYSGESAQWLDESWQIARKSGYPSEEEPGKTLSAAFHQKSRDIAERRLAEAAYRLADLLNRLINPREAKALNNCPAESGCP